MKELCVEFFRALIVCIVFFLISVLFINWEDAIYCLSMSLTVAWGTILGQYLGRGDKKSY